jgi:hypothetical protein
MQDGTNHIQTGQTNGRSENGRFGEGNAFGKGRPKLETERLYLHAIREACDFDSWLQIVTQAVIQAKEGEPKARTFLANYLIGRPNEKSITLKEINRFGDYQDFDTPTYESFEEEKAALDAKFLEHFPDGFRIGKYVFQKRELTEEELQRCKEKDEEEALKELAI